MSLPRECEKALPAWLCGQADGEERRKKELNAPQRGKCREEEEYKASLAQKREEYERKREEDPTLPPFKESGYTVDPDEDHFYIPEEKKYSAEFRFEKKGTSWLGFVAVIVIAVIVFFVLLLVIPEILKLLDELAGGIKATASGKNNLLT